MADVGDALWKGRKLEIWGWGPLLLLQGPLSYHCTNRHNLGFHDHELKPENSEMEGQPNRNELFWESFWLKKKKRWIMQKKKKNRRGRYRKQEWWWKEHFFFNALETGVDRREKEMEILFYLQFFQMAQVSLMGHVFLVRPRKTLRRKCTFIRSAWKR